jgi:capsid protein
MLDTKDPVLTQTIEHNFRQWSKALNLAEKLRIFRQAKIVDGESFGIITENPNLASRFSLDMQIIECDLVSSPDFTETMQNVDGIHYDGLIPIYYDILTDHPNAKTPSGSDEVSIPEPAENVIHYFRADRAGQRRGIPEVASALELCAMMRRYTLAVTTAAEAIASFGTGVMTGGDPNDYSDIGEAYDEFDLTHGMILSLPGGRDFKQLKAEQPSTTYKDFMRTLLSQIARCLNMPLNVALGDSSGYNFASGRLDHQFFFRSIQIERNKIECEILSRLFIKWLEEAALLGIVPVAALEMVGDWRINWIWDSFEHVDPVKEATASSLLLAGGFTDEFSEAARYGKDYRDVLERRKMARELREELGEPEPAPLSGLETQEDEESQDENEI